MIAIISAGNPIVSNTINIVTRPACGIAAAPTDANIEVKLKRITNQQNNFDTKNLHLQEI